MTCWLTDQTINKLTGILDIRVNCKLALKNVFNKKHDLPNQAQNLPDL